MRVKKYILTFGAIAAVATPIAAVVSCGKAASQEIPGTSQGDFGGFKLNKTELVEGTKLSKLNSNIGFKVLVTTKDDIGATSDLTTYSEKILDQLKANQDFVERLKGHDMFLVITLMNIDTLTARTTKAIFLSSDLVKNNSLNETSIKEIISGQGLKKPGEVPSIISNPPRENVFSTVFDSETGSINIIISSVPPKEGEKLSAALVDSIGNWLANDSQAQEFIQKIGTDVNVSIYFRNNYMASLLQTELGLANRKLVPSDYLDDETYVATSGAHHWGYSDFAYSIGRFDKNIFEEWAAKATFHKMRSDYSFNSFRQNGKETVFGLTINSNERKISTDSEPIRDPEMMVEPANRNLVDNELTEVINDFLSSREIKDQMRYISSSNAKFLVRYISNGDFESYKKYLEDKIVSSTTEPNVQNVINHIYERFGNFKGIDTPLSKIGIKGTGAEIKDKIVNSVKDSISGTKTSGLNAEQVQLIKKFWDWTVTTDFKTNMELDFDTKDSTVGLENFNRELDTIKQQELLGVFKAQKLAPLSLLDKKHSYTNKILQLIGNNSFAGQIYRWDNPYNQSEKIVTGFGDIATPAQIVPVIDQLNKDAEAISLAQDLASLKTFDMHIEYAETILTASTTGFNKLKDKNEYLANAEDIMLLKRQNMWQAMTTASYAFKVPLYGSSYAGYDLNSYYGCTKAQFEYKFAKLYNLLVAAKWTPLDSSLAMAEPTGAYPTQP